MNALRNLKSTAGRVRGILQHNRLGVRFAHQFSCTFPPDAPPDETTWLEKYFDDHESGPGIWKWRHYFPIYERHLSKFRGREVHIVEIGIFSGGSIGMWKSYFGDQAHIYGVDIAPACREYEGDRVRIFIGDQSDPNFWRDFTAEVPEIDIVIDDGGHRAFQQIATLESLLPALRPGGVYVCEDIHGEFNNFSDYLFGLTRNLNELVPKVVKQPGREPSPLQRTIDSIHFYPFVAVIERRSAPLDRMYSVQKGTEWQPSEFWQETEMARQHRH